MAQGFKSQVWMMTIVTDCDKKNTLVLNKVSGKACLGHGWKTNLSNPRNGGAYIKTLKQS